MRAAILVETELRLMTSMALRRWLASRFATVASGASCQHFFLRCHQESALSFALQKSELD
ncbi:MAG: hypothetical protein CMJ94_12970 [Planctomycetes bacterium]|nr:hypothetical protein [Planctomycetota bacterium]